MTVHHFDVTTTFLNERLKEEIFMEIPQYTVETLQEIVRRSPAEDVIGSKAAVMLNELNQGDKVCLLKRALYGLRQAGRCWYTRIDDEFLKFGARRSTADTCVYIKGDKEDLLIIAVYVDDILVASRNMKQIASFEEHLRKSFEITSCGELEHCLGMEFVVNQGEISVRQSAYIRDILERFGMSECKAVSTPMESGSCQKVNSDKEDPESKSLPYRKVLGALMYLSVCTRPDISFAFKSIL